MKKRNKCLQDFHERDYWSQRFHNRKLMIV